MFGSLPRGLPLGRPELSTRWVGVVRTLASSTAGIVFAAGLAGVAVLGLAPEPPVTAVVEGLGEVAQPVSGQAVTAAQVILAPPSAVAVTAPPVAAASATADPAIAAAATAAPATAAPAAEPAPAAPACLRAVPAPAVRNCGVTTW